MLLGQLRHGLGMRIRRAQLPLSLQLVWRWVLWCEQPGRPAEPHGCGTTTARPMCFHSRCSTYCLEDRSRGLPGSSQQGLCAHLVVHISPCNRIWFREWFLIYTSTSSGGCGNGLCHGPRLQGSVIIGGYWHLPSMTLLWTTELTLVSVQPRLSYAGTSAVTTYEWWDPETPAHPSPRGFLIFPVINRQYVFPK